MGIWWINLMSMVKRLSGLLMVFLLHAGIAFSVDVQAFTCRNEGQSGIDIFYQTPGTIQGPAAVREPMDGYSTFPFVNNRMIVWFVTQQHTYFGGFVLLFPCFVFY
jgi:hypothetical protein